MCGQNTANGKNWNVLMQARNVMKIKSLPTRIIKALLDSKYRFHGRRIFTIKLIYQNCRFKLQNC